MDGQVTHVCNAHVTPVAPIALRPSRCVSHAAPAPVTPVAQRPSRRARGMCLAPNQNPKRTKTQRNTGRSQHAAHSPRVPIGNDRPEQPRQNKHKHPNHAETKPPMIHSMLATSRHEDRNRSTSVLEPKPQDDSSTIAGAPVSQCSLSSSVGSTTRLITGVPWVQFPGAL